MRIVTEDLTGGLGSCGGTRYYVIKEPINETGICRLIALATHFVILVYAAFKHSMPIFLPIRIGKSNQQRKLTIRRG